MQTEVFGAEVYVRIRGWDGDKAELESVLDGCWHPCHRIFGMDGVISVPDDLYSAPTDMLLASTYQKVSDEWASLPTKTLLEVGMKRRHPQYYLPRAWNTSGPWITHEDLQKKYIEYVKERATCP